MATAAVLAALLPLVGCTPSGGADTGGGPSRASSSPSSAASHDTGDGAPGGKAPSGDTPHAPASPGGSDGGGAGPQAPASVRRTVPWNLDRLDQRHRPLDGTLTTRSTGSGVTVYVIDTGMDIHHPEFGGRASQGVDVYGEPDEGDCATALGYGHGTFVAGIIGGRKYGVAPKARLVRVQGIPCEGEGTPAVSAAVKEAKLVAAVAWVTLHARRPAVVNMSLNLDRPAPALDAAVKHMIESGIPTVVAAGNANRDACAYPPAGVPGAIVVAASTKEDRAWNDGSDYSSNYGRCVDLYAPGDRVTSAASDSDDTFTGEDAATSWAAPHVTGVAALYLSAHPDATPRQVQRFIDGKATRGVLGGVRADTPNRLLYTGGL